MASLKSSNHFVALGDVPAIEARTPTHEAFAALSKRGAGGFLVTQNGVPAYFVPARRFAETLQSEAAKESWATLLDRAVQEHLGRLRHAGIAVPVQPTPVDVSADPGTLEARVESVYRVLEAGQATGWYINREVLTQTVYTPPPTFVCGNGHPNPDPDRGTCGSCPAPIVGLAP